MHRKYNPHHDPRPDRGQPGGLPRVGLGWLAAAALAAWAATGVYVVEPNQRAVVWRCGRILDETSGPGIHFGFPLPVDRVTRLKMFEQKRVGIGLNLDDRNLGRAVEPRRAECLTGDRNLIAVSAIVQYDIVDAKHYLITTADVPAMIENLATAALSEVIASKAVDEVFTVGRLEIQQQVLAAVKDRLAQYQQQGQGLGVQINSVTLEEVRPPAEVEQAFRDVVSAREDRQRAIHEAEAYANALIPTAHGEAERIRLEAEGYAAETRELARGETDRFLRMIAALGQDRQLTVKRLILETLEEVLPRLKKVVLGEGAGRQLDLGLIEGSP